VGDVIAKFGHTMPTPQELAVMCGFDEQRVARLGMMWDVTFNQGWILVTRELVENDLGYSGGKNLTSNFVKNVLSKFNEGIDYRQVEHDSEWVKNHETLGSSAMRNLAKGHQRKHYIISGLVYKRLLMKATTKEGNAQGDYYCDVETLGLFYKDCSIAMCKMLADVAVRESHEKDARIGHHLLMIEEKDARLGQQQAAIEEKDDAIAVLKAQVITSKHISLNQYVYIATCRAFAADKAFKVGGVGSYDALSTRLSGYNSGHVVDDPFVFVYIAAVSDFMHVEKRIVQAIGGFRQTSKTHKEMYTVPYEYLLLCVSSICDGFAAENALLNANVELLAQGIITRAQYKPVACEWPARPGDAGRLAAPPVVDAPAAAPAEIDPIRMILNIGANNISDDEKSALVRMVIDRVTTRPITCKDAKEVLKKASADKKFKVGGWRFIKPVAARIDMPMEGRW
jgi:hypothetical protein